VAKSKSGEFYSFDEVLRQLSIDENRLKRLVSEGEIRAFREGDQMKFKRTEIDGLAGRGGRGSQTSETSLTEISLEDESQPTVAVGGRRGETLADDLLDEPDLSARGGMRTAEISSQDTFIDQSDVGMSTEPIDFTEETGEAEEIEDIAAERQARRGASRPAPRRVVMDEPATGAGWSVVLTLTALVGVIAALIVVDGSRSSARAWVGPSDFGRTIGDNFGLWAPEPPPKPRPGTTGN
jgi:excisionase family DNA binding protein